MLYVQWTLHNKTHLRLGCQRLDRPILTYPPTSASPKGVGQKSACIPHVTISAVRLILGVNAGNGFCCIVKFAKAISARRRIHAYAL